MPHWLKRHRQIIPTYEMDDLMMAFYSMRHCLVHTETDRQTDSETARQTDRQPSGMRWGDPANSSIHPSPQRDRQAGRQAVVFLGCVVHVNVKPHAHHSTTTESGTAMMAVTHTATKGKDRQTDRQTRSPLC